jgi:hypothetical protein
VSRSIGLTVGSALSAAILLANTRPRHQLPDASAFTVTLFVAAGFCIMTGLICYVLPGGAMGEGRQMDAAQRVELNLLMEGEAELGGTGTGSSDVPQTNNEPRNTR